jgi:hypothetical protein
LRLRGEESGASGHWGLEKEGKIMIIIDTATVSALLVVLAVAVLASVVTLGMVLRLYVAGRPARTARRTAAVQHARLAH